MKPKLLFFKYLRKIILYSPFVIVVTGVLGLTVSLELIKILGITLIALGSLLLCFVLWLGIYAYVSEIYERLLKEYEKES